MDFVKSYLSIFWDNFRWVLSSNILVWYIISFDFCMLNQHCISGLNPTWSSCIIQIYFAGAVCYYYPDDFCMYTCRIYWPIVFSCDISSFAKMVIVASLNELGSVTYSYIWGKYLWKLVLFFKSLEELTK